ncbi:hypothetical protein LTR17_018947 [Elasticomyces elasticus]|nr:hypothetical protein LTR17_018947 [Elasticomyces elasticus]
MIVKTGACQCGKIKYKMEGGLAGKAATPLYQTVCYCKNCRRGTGTAFLAASILPKEGFSITQGEESLQLWLDETTQSGKPLTRSFCCICGSKLFAWTPLRDDIVSVAAGTLDDFINWQPSKEQFCIDRPIFMDKIKGVDSNERHVTNVQSEAEQV